MHWFRRDLRVEGNPGLQHAWKECKGKVLGVFFFDPQFLARPDFSNDRFCFFLETLKNLRQDLRDRGSDLLVLDQGPKKGFEELLKFANSSKLGPPAFVSFNRDYEPFSIKRDADIPKHFAPLEFRSFRDHLIFEPHEIKEYKVYTPFSKTWFATLKSGQNFSRVTSQGKGLEELQLRSNGKAPSKIFQWNTQDLLGKRNPWESKLEEYLNKSHKIRKVPIPKAGALAAFECLQNFTKSKLKKYGEQRDFPHLSANSGLSVYLKNGSLTSAQILAYAKLKNLDEVFFKQVIWREFYFHVLAHHPRVETESYLEKYKNLEWENREDFFEKWKAGETGFPLVDAGMKELLETGLMHNRVRMVVASFLTKDLLIDWRWGERYFMERLLDGDLAANNGGWQWAASTGCDPQPYFRIFNPNSQAERFDPEGLYQKRWLGTSKRPLPMVDHAKQREKALALYKRKA